ncbi:type ISP restriction/modification enzyme [Laspinema olomoucense]|uniref:type ISP restriction/modification enzyme n=1 Tax=Laspinema olomoucense TaxID=3231600 RepID=UPI0021BB368E|nr:type ISP restriction/modification enzyme [Laspinema sp. D3a]MCT7992036.1 N-6 DNA methylase [Laspinema sp. D3a]
MPVSEYLKEISLSLESNRATEHTHRPALKTFLESLFPTICVTNEPKRIECGAPDYIVTNSQSIIGYIEAKDINKSLSKEENTSQLQRYLKGLSNLILTDYLEFRWYVNGEHRLTARLARLNSENKIKIIEDGVENVTNLLKQFIEITTPTVTHPQELASQMAALAQMIRNAIQQALKDSKKGNNLTAQLDSFRQVLLRDLTQEQFADMYAQTICYGMFAAACHSRDRSQFSRRDAAYELPKTNPFLRDMFSHIAGPNLDGSIAWAVDDLAELFKRAQLDEILKNFGKRTRKQDPVVHFYETFLAEYDPKLRQARGVYYTPEPVVSYIVNSVDYILKNDFGITKGLADERRISIPNTDGNGHLEIHQVLILDPATGTGTFLHGVIDHIYESFHKKKGMWSGYVHEHLLPRLFGFELLMAPYTVAHLKLGLQLQELGYDFTTEQRLQIYLTNTLQEAFQIPPTDGFTNWIRDEADRAKEIKQELPVMVVLGNPPYAYESKNTGDWITALVRDYYEVDGQPLHERNPKGLQDDYVKFIRCAQWRIEQTGYGVLAFITNHGYLDNPTFRGMRQNLMLTFDDIYVLDLHGNSKKKEQSPDGVKDENIFDIQQGVAIGIFVKRQGSQKQWATVHHAELWGMREGYEERSGDRPRVSGKYHWLWNNTINTTEWKTLEPRSPFYLFIPQNIDRLAEYETYWKVSDIFSVYSSGMNALRDGLVIALTRSELETMLKDSVNSTLSDEEFREKYKLGKDSRDWKLSDCRTQAMATGIEELLDSIRQCLYRPFDVRWIVLHNHFVGYPRWETTRHFLAADALGLATTTHIPHDKM